MVLKSTTSVVPNLKTCTSSLVCTTARPIRVHSFHDVSSQSLLSLSKQQLARQCVHEPSTSSSLKKLIVGHCVTRSFAPALLFSLFREICWFTWISVLTNLFSPIIGQFFPLVPSSSLLDSFCCIKPYAPPVKIPQTFCARPFHQRHGLLHAQKFSTSPLLMRLLFSIFFLIAFRASNVHCAIFSYSCLYVSTSSVLLSSPLPTPLGRRHHLPAGGCSLPHPPGPSQFKLFHARSLVLWRSFASMLPTC